MTTFSPPDIFNTAVQLISKHRRMMGARSLELFARTYLPQHFAHPGSSMHKELFALMEDLVEHRHRRVAIAAPRGHAKSTLVSLAYVLWCLCYGFDRFVVIISNTAEQACDLLAHIKTELKDNSVLQQDFPRVCSPASPSRWRRDDIVNQNSQRILALGAGEKIRGRRNSQFRPTLIIVDDLENDATVESVEQRDKLTEWLTKAVTQAGSAQTNIIVAGTILHYDSVLSRLIDPKRFPVWVGQKYQAVQSWSERQDLWERWMHIWQTDEEFEGRMASEAAHQFYLANKEQMLLGTQVLWPEHEDYYALMKLRYEMGSAAFDGEKQNEPVNPADCLFKSEDIRYWDDEFPDEEALLASLGESPVFYGACDPSMGKAGRNRDDSAIITLAKAKGEKILFVLDADIRKRVPDQIIQAIIEYNKRRKYRSFGIEAVQFQEFLASEVGRRSGHEVPVRKIIQSTDKLGRIQSLQPKVHSGMIRFSRRHHTLLNQLLRFPKADHDDGPDALHMAVSQANRPFIGITYSSDLPQ